MAKHSVVAPARIELEYFLAELPSSQHRAGLAGLILIARELENKNLEDLEIKEVTQSKATISLSESGVKMLFDEIYSASIELQESAAERKGEKAIDIITREVEDPKTSKTKAKKFYVYPNVVPTGSFLSHLDSSDRKIWIRLWREMVWQIMRGVPAQRRPFEDRAEGKDSKDYKQAWQQLCTDAPVDLPSTYFIGAQSANAERVPFKDVSRFQFLLHFWTFVAQIYVPQIIDKDGKRKTDQSFCIAVPDIRDLKYFCLDFASFTFEHRSNDIAGFRPKDAIIEIPQEAGLDTFRRMNHSISVSSGKMETADLVFGLDIFHTVKEGNNVRLLYSGRIVPNRKRDIEYEALKTRLRDHRFKRQRLVNLINETDWFLGFDKVLELIPIEEGLLSFFFGHDARESFGMEEEKHKEVLNMVAAGIEVQGDKVCLESLILDIMDEYLRKRLKEKHQLEWSKIQDDDFKKREFNEKRTNLAKDCFYAIRSRSEKDDFINYFASQICSVPHWMTHEKFLALTKELYGNTDRVRILSMLALSARIGRSDKKEDIENE